MDAPVYSPIAGDHAATSAPPLSPSQAKKFFEFFKAGTHREVLLLGELIEQPMHFVKSKNHKVLCGSRVGVCELCEQAATSEDIGTQQNEYLAPAFVREWSGREYVQRVAVFSAAAAEAVLRLIPEGSARGHRLDVTGVKRGTSNRYLIKALEGLPRAFPAVLPPAFDLVPWIRARFGKAQDPARPLVILPPFRAEAERPGLPGRPKSLDLSAADVKQSPEEIERIRALLKQGREMCQQSAELAPTPPTAAPIAPAKKQPSSVLAADPEAQLQRERRHAATRFARDVNGNLKNQDEPTAVGSLADSVLFESTGETVCREVKASAPCLNGKHPKKGGAA